MIGRAFQKSFIRRLLTSVLTSLHRIARLPKLFNWKLKDTNHSATDPVKSVPL